MTIRKLPNLEYNCGDIIYTLTHDSNLRSWDERRFQNMRQTDLVVLAALLEYLADEAHSEIDTRKNFLTRLV